MSNFTLIAKQVSPAKETAENSGKTLETGGAAKEKVKMNLQELNELDLNNIGDWPGLIKTILVLIICGAIGTGWYYFDTEDQLIQLKMWERQEQELRSTFEKKQAKAVNLEKYQKQLEEMKQSFGAMLRQLPTRPRWLNFVDVSQTGLAAGLEFELFDPLGENRKDFYAELPIKIKVGEYHQFGNFISGPPPCHVS